MPAFQDKSITALSAGQAAGTTTVLAADASRSLVILGNQGANAMVVTITNGGTVGIPLPAGGVVALGRDLPCPTNDLFIVGTVADKLAIWVG